jgi:hypothetical protein
LPGVDQSLSLDSVIDGITVGNPNLNAMHLNVSHLLFIDSDGRTVVKGVNSYSKRIQTPTSSPKLAGLKVALIKEMDQPLLLTQYKGEVIMSVLSLSEINNALSKYQLRLFDTLHLYKNNIQRKIASTIKNR